MSRKHKQKQDHFYRGNHEGIKKEKAAMVLSGLRVRAGMAAVSALLILSPIVISAAGSFAHSEAQDNTGISESGQTGSTHWFSEEDGGTGNTAADTGSTLAAVPQDTAMFPSDFDWEGIESNDASTGNTAAEGDEAAEPDEDFRENDDEVPDSSDSESETGDLNPDSHTTAVESDTSDTGSDQEQNEAAEDKDEADYPDGANAGKEDPNEDADSADASEDGSEDHEDGEKEASGSGITDPESAEDPEDQKSEQDKENESSAAFISDGEDDQAGSDMTTATDIDSDSDVGTQTESNEGAAPEDAEEGTGENILSEGEAVMFAENFTITQDDTDAGKLVRETDASAETIDSEAVKDEQTSEVILRSAASIDFSKEAAVRKISDAREGMSIQYYFTVTNSGNVTLRNIEVIDQMAGLSRIEYDWNGSTDSSTGEGYLSPGEKVTASARYAITSDDIRKGKIVNKAFARGETLQGTVIESSQPEAPTTISQEGKGESSYISPATGDFTDIYAFLTPFIVSAAALIAAVVLGKMQSRKMDFGNEEKD